MRYRFILLAIACAGLTAFDPLVGRAQPRKFKVHISRHGRGGRHGHERSTRARRFRVLALSRVHERVDSHSIRFHAKDMAEASAIMEFISEYRPDITP